jgi:predicted MPP superfamily phosphohydrolase
MGRRNAGRPRLTEVTFHFASLPAAFDGYRILFLSDLHLGYSPDALAAGIALAEGQSCDLAVLGGDFQSWGRPTAAEVVEHMRPVLAALRPTDGIVGVLGNHDTHDLVPPLEAVGVRMLLNENLDISRDGQSIHLIGCDDVHAFYDHGAEAALRRNGGFRVALVHSPDFAGQAAAAGCSLYLAGHTHGGQICLPGGRPILTALDRNHQLARGAWRLRGMQGYTSTGLGSGLPVVRFNCPPEVVLITLHRDEAALSLT